MAEFCRIAFPLPRQEEEGELQMASIFCSMLTFQQVYVMHHEESENCMRDAHEVRDHTVGSQTRPLTLIAAYRLSFTV